ncbi:MAG: DUF262 domain-containing protein [Victivallales bacterium]|nr:DUF262 domain-containing protein [Victivallales bacterium]
MDNKSTDIVMVPVKDYSCEPEDINIPEEDRETRALQKPFDPKKICVMPQFTSMSNIIMRLQENRINMEPDFQRASGIWNQKNKERLIESLIIKLPLPAFYFDMSDNDNWVVIDGLQRLTAIKEFVVEQKWTLKKNNLEFLGEDCDHMKYSDLPGALRGNINESQVMVCGIMAGTPARLKFDIFRRINTGGYPLNSQEIRHALNPGSITSFLKELADLPEFKEATENGFEPLRMVDRECVLRFLVFFENDSQKYAASDFDRFLNEYMEGFNNRFQSAIYDEADNRYRLKQDFRLAMQLARDIFGNDAFRKRYKTSDARHPLNKALFEAWAVNLAKLSEAEREALLARKENLKSAFMQLMCDGKLKNWTPNESFEVSITQGTASVSRVKCRFETIRQLIQEVLYA